MHNNYNGNLDKQWDNIIGDEYGRCIVINNQDISKMAKPRWEVWYLTKFKSFHFVVQTVILDIFR